MYAGSKAFFYALSRSALLKRLASKYGLATNRQLRPPVHRRRDDRGGDRGGAHAAGAGTAPHARLPRREREDARGSDGRHARIRPADRCHRRLRHRAEHLAEADAARRRRRPRDLRRQPAPHPRPGRAPRFLRPHRHGELAVHRADARDLRDAVAAGLPQPRRGAAVVPVSHRARRPADERAWARACGWSRAPTRSRRRWRISRRQT